MRRDALTSFCRSRFGDGGEIGASLATPSLLRTLTEFTEDVANPSRTARHLTAPARLGQFLLLLPGLRRLGKLPQYIVKTAEARCAALAFLGAMR